MLLKRSFVWALLLVALATQVTYSQTTRTLYDRLGGETGLTRIVDDWYNHLVADPKLSDRFGGPDKTYLRNEYLNFFTTFTGGPRVYHGRDLSNVHRHLRVTADEWDATIGHMQTSLRHFNVPPSTAQEFLNKIASVRHQVVQGPGSDRPLYDRLGGEPGLTAIVDDFFDRLVADPQLQDRFTGTNLSSIKHEVVDYLGQLTGGPQRYQGPDMKSAHWRMHITPQEWDITLNHLREAMDRNQVPDTEASELSAIVQQLRPQIVHDR